VTVVGAPPANSDPPFERGSLQSRAAIVKLRFRAALP
jgi:hypothetical protein